MRSRTFSIVTTATLLALVLAAGSAMAQTSVVLKADIPFAFHAGPATLPAGEYTVQAITATNAMALARIDRSAQAMVLTNAAEGRTVSAESKLVFRKYGDRYFLSQIWTAGQARGRALPVSKTERELTNLAAKYQVVAVFAKR